MSSTTVKHLQPSGLRTILVVAMILTLVGSIAGFVYGLGMLNSFAVDVSHKKVDAEASNNSLKTLQQLERSLNASRNTLKRTSQLSITNELPQFQAVEDVRNIANRNKLPISSITFTDGTTAPKTATTAPSTSTPAQTPTPTAAPVNTGKQVSVNLVLGDNVSYASFVQFLYDTERSLPNMQIDEIHLAPGSNKNAVSPGTVTIKVSIT